MENLITPSLSALLQALLGLGIRPDSFALESVLSQSLPGGKREGAPGTLVDVMSDLGAFELKSTGSVDLLKREPKEKGNCIYLEDKKLWARWNAHPVVIFRRPDFSHYEENDAEAGIQRNVERARDFYEASARKAGVKEIRSLLVQHSFDPKKNFTVFRFSEGEFYLPNFDRAEKTDKGLFGYSKSGQLLYKHDSFTKGSQNFSKVYKTGPKDIIVCIDHVVPTFSVNDWESLNGVQLLA